ncbi:Nephrocystin-3 [Ilyonectria robusta]
MDFVGRTTVLDTLKDMLFAQTSTRRVALVGLGGMGKTQVALHLAHWVKHNHPDHSVFWMPAFSMASFEQACTELVKKLNIQCTEEKEDAKELVRQHLSSQDLGSWLLIVDNADDIEILDGLEQRPSGILDFLPQSNYGRILFTTRSQEVAVVAAKTKVVRLSEMSWQEATSFLEKSLLQQDPLQNNGLVAELLEKLTYLPLAIAQAAAYMNMNQASVEEYMRLLRLTDQDMIQLLRRRFRDGTHYHSSQSAVATTWTMSFDQIRRTDSLAANLLSFVAFIEPKAIPRSLLPRSGTEQQMTQALGTLLGYGFLSRRGDDQLFDMHSLVHLATRIQSQDQETADKIQRDVLAHLTEVFPTDQWENRESWQQYLPHALRAIGIRKGVDNGVCELEFWVGRCLLVDGRTQEAINLLEHVVGIQKRTLVETDLSRLSSQHSLARAYRADRRVKDAVSLQGYVVKIYKETLPEDHSDRLTSQHTLAGAYQADGQIKAAVELMEYVVGIRKKVLVEDHPDRLASQHALALTYRAHRQVKEAIELLEHVVKIYTKTLVEDHPFRLTSQHELAGAYQANGQMKEAVELLEHVVRMREKVLAEDHFSRLASQQELAGAYQASGQVKEAIELLQHVVRIRKKVLVEDHHSLLVSQQKLAGAYQSDGQVTKAIELLEHVVRIRESVLAEDHPARLTSQEELAAAYQANGQVKEAAELLGYVNMIQQGASTQEPWVTALDAYLMQPDEQPDRWAGAYGSGSDC